VASALRAGGSPRARCCCKRTIFLFVLVGVRGAPFQGISYFRAGFWLAFSSTHEVDSKKKSDAADTLSKRNHQRQM